MKKTALKILGIGISCMAISLIANNSISTSDDRAHSRDDSINLESACDSLSLPHEDNLLVDMVDGLTSEQIQEWQKKYGLNLRYNSEHSRQASLLIGTVDTRDLPKLLETLNGDELVESAEPNLICQLFPTEGAGAISAKRISILPSYPNDPGFKYQWHLNMVNSPRAWKFSQGRGAVVAVIDTGVAWKETESNIAVEDLAQTKIVKGYDFTSPIPNALALDDNAHGTHVAGTIAQSTNNNLGACGMAPKAAIMPVKVLDRRGMGSTSDIVDGIRFAADHGANVINMSLGGPLPSLAIHRAVSYAESKGVLVVCAAGNEHKKGVSYPAGYTDSLAVSALNAKGEIAWYSNYGSRVDISAPGGDTRTDDNGDGMPDGVYQNTIDPRDPSRQGYYAFQGTSMASPHVAGAAAVLVGQGVTSPKALKKILTSTAQSKGKDSKSKGYGSGALDVGKAAFRVGFWYGLGRLLLALTLALGLGAFCSKRTLKERAIVLSSLVMGASGLFFLPLFFQAECALNFLALPMPVWDVFFLGASTHGNLLVCSCLIPALLSLGAHRCRCFCRLLAGLSIGWGAYMLGELFTGATLLHLLPSCLSWLWWSLNGVFCLFLAKVLLEDNIANKSNA